MEGVIISGKMQGSQVLGECRARLVIIMGFRLASVTWVGQGYGRALSSMDLSQGLRVVFMVLSNVATSSLDGRKASSPTHKPRPQVPPIR